MNADLPYLAALHGLGTLDADSMKSAVDRCMNDGFYADECLDALDSKPAQLAEVLPAFKAALAHFRVKIPSYETAVWQLIEHHLRSIASTGVDPWHGLSALIRDVYWTYDFHSSIKKFIGDSHGIHRLVGIYWDIDDLAGRSGGTAVLGADGFKPDEFHLEAIRDAADEWLAVHAGQHAA